MRDYSYAKLKSNESMRMLKLLAGLPGDPVYCHLSHLLKGDEYQYDALSYAWDNQIATSSIVIIKSDTHYNHPVIPNLEAALRQLRHRERDIVLWVDAICINQASNDEKSHQVPLMAKIYSEANNVRIWLGEEVPDKSEVALKFITRILDFENFDRLIADSRLVQEWASLFWLMKRSWFGRRWVVQEVALARKAFLHCGKDWVAWDDFADAVNLFEEKAQIIQEHFMSTPELGYRSDLVQDIGAMSATRLVHATSNLFRKSNNGTILEWMRDLETLVSELSAFEASNPRDVIYGVLALARDTKSTAPKRIIGKEIAMPPNANPDPPMVPERGDVPTPAPSMSPPVSPLGGKKRKHLEESLAAKRQRMNGIDVANVAELPTDPGRSPSPALKNHQPTQPLTFDNEQKRLVKLFMNKLRNRIADRTYNVDYDKSFFQVCKYFLIFVTRKSKSLDILCRPWAPSSPKLPNNPNSDELPSWIPKLSAGAYRKREDGTFMRIGADPLVGVPNQNGGQNYNASKSFEAKCRFGDPFLQQNAKSLFAQGIILDTIGQTSWLPAVSGDVPDEWPGFAGWHDLSQKPPKTFWMTLVAGRGPNGLNAPDYFGRACQHVFKKKVDDGQLDVRYLLNDPAFNTTAKLFLRRMQSVVWMRRLMRTEEKRILGLVPAMAKEGDRICILFGCSVPVVLREESHGGPHFKVIGECYIDGMMDGQALDSDKGKPDQYRMFELR